MSAFAKSLLLVVVTWLAYLPALHGEFIWDDWQIFIGNNPLLRDFAGLQNIWLSTNTADYYPLTYTSFWVEWHLWSYSPTGYHAVNTLLHVANSLLLWRVLKHLALPLPWFTALLFAIHPVNVESVAWISERKNTLCMFFSLLTLRSYITETLRPERVRYSVSVVLFALALLSKSAAAPLPMIVLGIDIYLRDRTVASRIRAVAPFFTMALAFAALTIWFNDLIALGAEPIRTDDMLSRTVGASWAIWFYALKAIWPVGLNFHYPRWEIDVVNAWSYLPALGLIVVVGLGFWKRKSWGKVVLISGAAFVVMLAPVLGFFDIPYMQYSFVADHWQYFSLPSLLAAINFYGDKLLLVPAARIPTLALGGILLPAALMALTWNQAALYKTEIAIYQDSIAKSPRPWVAHINLGRVYEKRRDFAQAHHHYDAAVRERPPRGDLVTAIHNRGVSLIKQNDYSTALADFEQVLDLSPEHERAHLHKGICLYELGRWADALSSYAEAARLDPSDQLIYLNMATVYARQGNLERAHTFYTKALDLARPGWEHRSEIEARVRRINHQLGR